MSVKSKKTGKHARTSKPVGDIGKRLREAAATAKKEAGAPAPEAPPEAPQEPTNRDILLHEIAERDAKARVVEGRIGVAGLRKLREGDHEPTQLFKIEGDEQLYREARPSERAHAIRLRKSGGYSRLVALDKPVEEIEVPAARNGEGTQAPRPEGLKVPKGAPGHYGAGLRGQAAVHIGPRPRRADGFGPSSPELRDWERKFRMWLKGTTAAPEAPKGKDKGGKGKGKAAKGASAPKKVQARKRGTAVPASAAAREMRSGGSSKSKRGAR